MKSQDRVAIITGAARGIGAAIAKNFAERAYSVLLVDANAEVTETASSLGPHAQAFVADVSSTDSVIEAVRNCADRFGSVDILVNNAGISPKPNGVKTPVEAMDRADWDRVMAINLTGAFMFCKAVIPFMRERGWGRIINISSMAGRSRSQLAAAHYSASKAGMIGFSRVLAGEVADAGITVNCVAPGRIRSPMAVEHGEQLNIEAMKRIPVGRLGKPEEIGALVAFLASEEAAFITGATYDMNGGEFMG